MEKFTVLNNSCQLLMHIIKTDHSDALLSHLLMINNHIGGKGHCDEGTWCLLEHREALEEALPEIEGQLPSTALFVFSLSLSPPPFPSPSFSFPPLILSLISFTFSSPFLSSFYSIFYILTSEVGFPHASTLYAGPGYRKSPSFFLYF